MKSTAKRASGGVVFGSRRPALLVRIFDRANPGRKPPWVKVGRGFVLIWSDFTTPEEVNAVYRRRARFYDWSVNAYYLIGFRWWAYRRRAVAALQLQRGATVVEIGCGTGLNFGLLQQRIGPSGHLLGVDLCADMLERAGRRVAAKGWTNVELIQAQAAEFEFPAAVDAVLSTFALSLEPRLDEVIAKAAAVLAPGGRFLVLDLRMPSNWLRHFAPALIWLVRPFAVSLEVAKRQPWESLRRHFPGYSYQAGYLGIVYIASGAAAGQQSNGRVDRTSRFRIKGERSSIGGSSSPPIPANVASLNRQPPFTLGRQNWSSWP